MQCHGNQHSAAGSGPETFEQFVSTLRKERRKADEQFVQETIKRFNELKVVIEQVQHAAQQILIKHSP